MGSAAGSRTGMALAADGTAGPPTGPAGGDLAGTYPDPTVVQASGAFALPGDISDTIAANQNDYNPAGLATASTILVDGGVADRDLTGLAGGADGRIVVVQNVGTTNTLRLTDQDVLSAAANRFQFAQGLSLTLRRNGGSCVLQYDATATRWHCIGESA